VRGYIDLLLNEDMGTLSERQRQGMEIISTKTAAVTQLVNNIMFLQQLEKSTLQFAIFDLAALARDSIAKTQASLHSQNTSLHLDAPLELAEADRQGVLKTAFEHGATVYDAVFIALATAYDATLLTAGRTTTRWVKRLGKRVEIVR